MIVMVEAIEEVIEAHVHVPIRAHEVRAVADHDLEDLVVTETKVVAMTDIIDIVSFFY